MVQGLAFLSKKSWHTKNLANQEKVWMAEQRKAAEEQKTKELARQIQQEREQAELDRISGKKTALDVGIDWMYQGQQTTGEQSELEKQDEERRAEEFLMGKQYVPAGAAVGDFANAASATEGVNAVVSSISKAEEPANVEPTVAERNEAFRQRVEDPMFLVSQRHREKQVDQQKKKALYERVIGVSSDKKAAKKDRKRDRKRHSRQSSPPSRRSRERDDLDARETSRYRRRQRDDSGREERRGRSRHERRADYREDSVEHDRHYESKRRHSRNDSERRRKRDRSSDRYERKRTSRRSLSRSRSRSRSPSPYRSRRSHSPHKNTTNDSHPPSRNDLLFHDYKSHQQQQNTVERKKPGYGLNGGKGATTAHHDRESLGPDKELLRKRKETMELERRNNRQRANSRRALTTQERERAILEMQSEAEIRTADRRSFQKSSTHDDKDYKAQSEGKATFLKDITQRTHGLKAVEETSLAKRMAQNRNKNQNIHDEAFL